MPPPSGGFRFKRGRGKSGRFSADASQSRAIAACRHGRLARRPLDLLYLSHDATRLAADGAFVRRSRDRGLIADRKRARRHGGAVRDSPERPPNPRPGRSGVATAPVARGTGSAERRFHGLRDIRSFRFAGHHQLRPERQLGARFGGRAGAHHPLDPGGKVRPSPSGAAAARAFQPRAARAQRVGDSRHARLHTAGARAGHGDPALGGGGGARSLAGPDLDRRRQGLASRARVRGQAGGGHARRRFGRTSPRLRASAVAHHRGASREDRGLRQRPRRGLRRNRLRPHQHRRPAVKGFSRSRPFSNRPAWSRSSTRACRWWSTAPLARRWRRF